MIATGDAGRVKRKLAREPESIDARDDEGLTPLRRSLYAGNDDLASLILERGPALDTFDAAAIGDVEALRRALGRSAKRANAFSEDGFAPLHLAAYFGRLDAAELLLDRSADIEARSTNSRLRHVTPLHSAAAGRQTAVAVLLLDRGADPNVVQPGGWTPLHQAAANGHRRPRRPQPGQGPGITST